MTDLTPHITWSQDDEWYYAAVEVQAPDGQAGVIEVRVSRPWVVRTAQEVRKRLLTTAPHGVDVGAWGNLNDPERWGKLCRYVAGTEAKRQVAEQVKRDGIVVAPWFGEWTIATADAAYRLIKAAQDGDDASIDQLDRLREHAEAGDPAARKALQMINSVAKLVARNLPPPSVVATRLPQQIGALPVRRRVTPAPTRRRVVPARAPAAPARPQRALPPRRTAAPAAAAPSGFSGTVTGMPATAPAPAFRPGITARPRPLAAYAPPLAPGVIAPAPYPPAPQYPYGYGYPPMMPSDGGGWSGGGGGDLGPEDYMAPEEDDGGGGMLDDDGTYYEEPGVPDEAFTEEPEQYAVGSFPEEIAQSEGDEDEGDGDDEANAAAVDAGGAFPGEGGIADRR